MSKFAPTVSATRSAPDKEASSENQDLRRQLRALLAEARYNEDKLRRFQEFELRLIGAGSLFELLRMLLHEYRVAARLDRVALVLFDPEYELRRILAEEAVVPTEHPDLSFAERPDFATRGAYIGAYRPELHGRIFPAHAPLPASVALLPLVRRGDIVGVLAFGSLQLHRYVNGAASDFLERLAAIFAVCMENVLNRARLKRVGLTDVLTGVNNRRFFDQRLREETALTRRTGTSLTCLFFDVDRFKLVNDTYGHQAGDRVLREVAALIRMNLRTADVLARYGGEEFAALLLHSNATEAVEVAERIRQCIAMRDFLLDDGRALKVTISIGVATLDGKNQTGDVDADAQDLVERADRGVLLAKTRGRNRVVVDGPEGAVPREAG